MNFVFNGTVTDGEMFKSFIQSIKFFPLTKAMFYVKNNTGLDLDKFLKKIFSDCSYSYNEKINEIQEDWQLLYNKFDSDFVWVCSRYDHHFVDVNTQHLNDVLEFRNDAGTDKLASIYLSNWLDGLKRCVIIDHGIWDGEKHPAPTQAWISIEETDSFQIATKALYHSWFFDQDFKKLKIRSLEELTYKADLIRPWKIQVPSREQLRSFYNINESYNFYNIELSADVRKQKFNNYYYTAVSETQPYLANPKFDPGIYNRILRHYQL